MGVRDDSKPFRDCHWSNGLVMESSAKATLRDELVGLDQLASSFVPARSTLASSKLACCFHPVRHVLSREIIVVQAALYLLPIQSEMAQKMNR